MTAVIDRVKRFRINNVLTFSHRIFMNHKILMIGWEYPPHITGGLGMACKGLARALAEEGHELIFLVPRLFGDETAPPGVHLMDVPEGLALLTEEELARLPALQITRETVLPGVYATRDVDTQLIPGAEAKIVTRQSLDQIRLQGGYGPGVYREIRWYADYVALLAPHLDIDVIHCHDWITYPAGMGAAVATGKPLVAHVHATEIDRSGENVNQFVYDLEREMFHRCNAVVTVSNFTRDLLLRHYGVPGHRVQAIHNGVEFELPGGYVHEQAFRPEEAGLPESERLKRDRLVLFMGRITFQKGPDYFVRAARIVVSRLPGVRFVMAGSGDMYHRMIEMAADLGIGKYFHYTGFLNKEEVTRLFAMSDLYIMPSVSEPFGLSPLEAMLHGVPTIVSKQSGVSEVISNCIKVDFWNVEDIAAAIISVLENKTLAGQLANGGAGEVQRVTWRAAAEKITRLYDDLRGGV